MVSSSILSTLYVFLFKQKTAYEVRISDWSSDLWSSDLGGAFEITQPIQMRFNELIAGVRGDIAVKVFGDDADAMNATANAIAAVLRKTEGAVDVRVEQTEGLPMLDIRPRRDIMSRL